MTTFSLTPLQRLSLQESELVNSIIDTDHICIAIQRSIVNSQEFNESRHKADSLTSKISEHAQKYFAYLSSLAVLRMEARTANWPFWSYSSGRCYAKAAVEAFLAAKFLLFYSTVMCNNQELLVEGVLERKRQLLHKLTGWMKWLEDLPHDVLDRVYALLSEKDMQLWEMAFSYHELSKVKPLLEFLNPLQEEEKNFTIMQLIQFSQRILDRRCRCSKKVELVQSKESHSLISLSFFTKDDAQTH